MAKAGAMAMAIAIGRGAKQRGCGAEVALGRYMRQGFAADPTDPEHIAAYNTMLQFSHRITGQSFMHYLQSQVNDIGSGGNIFTHFWAVPKSSFPGGLPPAAAEALVPDDQLDDMEVRRCGTLHRHTYYVVDQVVPRESLGRNVHTLELDVTNSTRVAQRPASTLWSSPATSDRKRPVAALSKTQRDLARSRCRARASVVEDLMPSIASGHFWNLSKAQRDRVRARLMPSIASGNFWNLSKTQRDRVRARPMRLDLELDPEESLSSGSPDRSSSEGGGTP